MAEEDTSFIWIETKVLAESADVLDAGTVHLNFANVATKQVEFFAERLGQTDNVAEASRLVDQGVITSPWQFAFTASRGEATLLRALDDLDNAELLALFLLSAHFVAFRRHDMAFAEAQELLARIPLLWFHDDTRLSNMRSLLVALSSGNANRRPLLVSEKHGNAGTWVGPLHYNFARQVVRTGPGPQRGHDRFPQRMWIPASPGRAPGAVPSGVVQQHRTGSSGFVPASQ